MEEFWQSPTRWTDDGHTDGDARDGGGVSDRDDQQRWYLVQFQLCTLGFSFIMSITWIGCSRMYLVYQPVQASAQLQRAKGCQQKNGFQNWVSRAVKILNSWWLATNNFSGVGSRQSVEGKLLKEFRKRCPRSQTLAALHDEVSRHKTEQNKKKKKPPSEASCDLHVSASVSSGTRTLEGLSELYSCEIPLDSGNAESSITEDTDEELTTDVLGQQLTIQACDKKPQGQDLNGCPDDKKTSSSMDDFLENVVDCACLKISPPPKSNDFQQRSDGGRAVMIRINKIQHTNIGNTVKRITARAQADKDRERTFTHVTLAAKKEKGQQGYTQNKTCLYLMGLSHGQNVGHKKLDNTRKLSKKDLDDATSDLINGDLSTIISKYSLHDTGKSHPTAVSPDVCKTEEKRFQGCPSSQRVGGPSASIFPETSTTLSSLHRASSQLKNVSRDLRQRIKSQVKRGHPMHPSSPRSLSWTNFTAEVQDKSLTNKNIGHQQKKQKESEGALKHCPDSHKSLAHCDKDKTRSEILQTRSYVQIQLVSSHPGRPPQDVVHGQAPPERSRLKNAVSSELPEQAVDEQPQNVDTIPRRWTKTPKTSQEISQKLHKSSQNWQDVPKSLHGVPACLHEVRKTVHKSPWKPKVVESHRSQGDRRRYPERCHQQGKPQPPSYICKYSQEGREVPLLHEKQYSSIKNVPGPMRRKRSCEKFQPYKIPARLHSLQIFSHQVRQNILPVRTSMKDDGLRQSCANIFLGLYLKKDASVLVKHPNIVSRRTEQSCNIQNVPRRTEQSFNIQNVLRRTEQSFNIQNLSRRTEQSCNIQNLSRRTEQSFNIQNLSRRTEQSFNIQNLSRRTEQSCNIQNLSRRTEQSFNIQNVSRRMEQSFNIQNVPRRTEQSFNIQNVPRRTEQSFNIQNVSRRTEQSCNIQNARSIISWKSSKAETFVENLQEKQQEPQMLVKGVPASEDQRQSGLLPASGGTTDKSPRRFVCDQLQTEPDGNKKQKDHDEVNVSSEKVFPSCSASSLEKSVTTAREIFPKRRYTNTLMSRIDKAEQVTRALISSHMKDNLDRSRLHSPDLTKHGKQKRVREYNSDMGQAKLEHLQNKQITGSPRVRKLNSFQFSGAILRKVSPEVENKSQRGAHRHSWRALGTECEKSCQNENYLFRKMRHNSEAKTEVRKLRKSKIPRYVKTRAKPTPGGKYKQIAAAVTRAMHRVRDMKKHEDDKAACQRLRPGAACGVWKDNMKENTRNDVDGLAPGEKRHFDKTRQAQVWNLKKMSWQSSRVPPLAASLLAPPPLAAPLLAPPPLAPPLLAPPPLAAPPASEVTESPGSLGHYSRSYHTKKQAATARELLGKTVFSSSRKGSARPGLQTTDPPKFRATQRLPPADRHTHTAGEMTSIRRKKRLMLAKVTSRDAGVAGSDNSRPTSGGGGREELKKNICDDVQEQNTLSEGEECEKSNLLAPDMPRQDFTKSRLRHAHSSLACHLSGTYRSAMPPDNTGRRMSRVTHHKHAMSTHNLLYLDKNDTAVEEVDSVKHCSQSRDSETYPGGTCRRPAICWLDQAEASRQHARKTDRNKDSKAVPRTKTPFRQQSTLRASHSRLIQAGKVYVTCHEACSRSGHEQDAGQILTSESMSEGPAQSTQHKVKVCHSSPLSLSMSLSQKCLHDVTLLSPTHTSIRPDNLVASPHTSIHSDKLVASPHISIRLDNLVVFPHTSSISENLVTSPYTSIHSDKLVASPHISIRPDNLVVTPHTSSIYENLVASPRTSIYSDKLVAFPLTSIHSDNSMVFQHASIHSDKLVAFPLTSIHSDNSMVFQHASIHSDKLVAFPLTSIHSDNSMVFQHASIHSDKLVASPHISHPGSCIINESVTPPDQRGSSGGTSSSEHISTMRRSHLSATESSPRANASSGLVCQKIPESFRMKMPQQATRLWCHGGHSSNVYVGSLVSVAQKSISSDILSSTNKRLESSSSQVQAVHQIASQVQAVHQIASQVQAVHQIASQGRMDSSALKCKLLRGEQSCQSLTQATAAKVAPHIGKVCASTDLFIRHLQSAADKAHLHKAGQVEEDVHPVVKGDDLVPPSGQRSKTSSHESQIQVSPFHSYVTPAAQDEAGAPRGQDTPENDLIQISNITASPDQGQPVLTSNFRLDVRGDNKNIFSRFCGRQTSRTQKGKNIWHVSQERNTFPRTKSALCASTASNITCSSSKLDHTGRSSTNLFTEVDCPDQTSCRRTKLVRTFPEDVTSSLSARKPAMPYRMRKGLQNLRSEDRGQQAKEETVENTATLSSQFDNHQIGNMCINDNLSVTNKDHIFQSKSLRERIKEKWSESSTSQLMNSPPGKEPSNGKVSSKCAYPSSSSCTSKEYSRAIEKSAKTKSQNLDLAGCKHGRLVCGRSSQQISSNDLLLPPACTSLQQLRAGSCNDAGKRKHETNTSKSVQSCKTINHKQSSKFKFPRHKASLLYHPEVSKFSSVVDVNKDVIKHHLRANSVQSPITQHNHPTSHIVLTISKTQSPFLSANTAGGKSGRDFQLHCDQTYTPSRRSRQQGCDHTSLVTSQIKRGKSYTGNINDSFSRYHIQSTLDKTDNMRGVICKETGGVICEKIGRGTWEVLSAAAGEDNAAATSKGTYKLVKSKAKSSLDTGRSSQERSSLDTGRSSQERSSLDTGRSSQERQGAARFDLVSSDTHVSWRPVTEENQLQNLISSNSTHDEIDVKEEKIHSDISIVVTFSESHLEDNITANTTRDSQDESNIWSEITHSQTAVTAASNTLIPKYRHIESQNKMPGGSTGRTQERLLTAGTESQTRNVPEFCPQKTNSRHGRHWFSPHSEDHCKSKAAKNMKKHYKARNKMAADNQGSKFGPSLLHETSKLSLAGDVGAGRSLDTCDQPLGHVLQGKEHSRRKIRIMRTSSDAENISRTTPRARHFLAKRKLVIRDSQSPGLYHEICSSDHNFPASKGQFEEDSIASYIAGIKSQTASRQLADDILAPLSQSPPRSTNDDTRFTNDDSTCTHGHSTGQPLNSDRSTCFRTFKTQVRLSDGLAETSDHTSHQRHAPEPSCALQNKTVKCHCPRLPQSPTVYPISVDNRSEAPTNREVDFWGNRFPAGRYKRPEDEQGLFWRAELEQDKIHLYHESPLFSGSNTPTHMSRSQDSQTLPQASHYNHVAMCGADAMLSPSSAPLSYTSLIFSHLVKTKEKSHRDMEFPQKRDDLPATVSLGERQNISFYFNEIKSKDGTFSFPVDVDEPGFLHAAVDSVSLTSEVVSSSPASRRPSVSSSASLPHRTVALKRGISSSRQTSFRRCPVRGDVSLSHSPSPLTGECPALSSSSDHASSPVNHSCQRPVTRYSYLHHDSLDRLWCRRKSPPYFQIRDQRSRVLKIKRPKEDTFVGKIVDMFEKKFQFLAPEGQDQQVRDILASRHETEPDVSELSTNSTGHDIHVQVDDIGQGAETKRT